jgi:YrbI family 3-deoxy-D-manno-octulosonate 8-phosphate phosphatase
MAAARPGKVRIDLLVFDVDGVLTDGTLLIDADGREWKRLRYRDLDAVTAAMASGLRVAFLSGETGPLFTRIAERFGIQLFSSGAKDKVRGLTALAQDAGVPMSRVCYVGDSDRDAPALVLAAIGLAPRDASALARKAADGVLRTAGGRGVAVEVIERLTRRGCLRK